MAALGSETHKHFFEAKDSTAIHRIICSQCGRGLGSMISPKNASTQIMPFMISDEAYNGDDITYMTVYDIKSDSYNKHPTLCSECWEKTKITMSEV